MSDIDVTGEKCTHVAEFYENCACCAMVVCTECVKKGVSLPIISFSLDLPFCLSCKNAISSLMDWATYGAPVVPDTAPETFYRLDIAQFILESLYLTGIGEESKDVGRSALAASVAAVACVPAAAFGAVKGLFKTGLQGLIIGAAAGGLVGAGAGLKEKDGSKKKSAKSSEPSTSLPPPAPPSSSDSTADAANNTATESKSEGAAEQPSLPSKYMARAKEIAKMSIEEQILETDKELQRVKDAKDAYEVLGLDKKCLQSDIKSAHRVLSLAFHPDRNSAPSAQEVSQFINNAHALIATEELRKSYDSNGKGKGDVNADAGDIDINFKISKVGVSAGVAAGAVAGITGLGIGAVLGAGIGAVSSMKSTIDRAVDFSSSKSSTSIAISKRLFTLKKSILQAAGSAAPHGINKLSVAPVHAETVSESEVLKALRIWCATGDIVNKKITLPATLTFPVYSSPSPTLPLSKNSSVVLSVQKPTPNISLMPYEVLPLVGINNHSKNTFVSRNVWANPLRKTMIVHQKGTYLDPESRYFKLTTMLNHCDSVIHIPSIDCGPDVVVNKEFRKQLLSQVPVELSKLMNDLLDALKVILKFIRSESGIPEPINDEESPQSSTSSSATTTHMTDFERYHEQDTYESRDEAKKVRINNFSEAGKFMEKKFKEQSDAFSSFDTLNTILVKLVKAEAGSWGFVPTIDFIIRRICGIMGEGAYSISNHLIKQEILSTLMDSVGSDKSSRTKEANLGLFDLHIFGYDVITEEFLGFNSIDQLTKLTMNPIENTKDWIETQHSQFRSRRANVTVVSSDNSDATREVSSESKESKVLNRPSEQSGLHVGVANDISSFDKRDKYIRSRFLAELALRREKIFAVASIIDSVSVVASRPILEDKSLANPQPSSTPSDPISLVVAGATPRTIAYVSIGFSVMDLKRIGYDLPDELVKLYSYPENLVRPHLSHLVQVFDPKSVRSVPLSKKGIPVVDGVGNIWIRTHAILDTPSDMNGLEAISVDLKISEMPSIVHDIISKWNAYNMKSINEVLPTSVSDVKVADASAVLKNERVDKSAVVKNGKIKCQIKVSQSLWDGNLESNPASVEPLQIISGKYFDLTSYETSHLAFVSTYATPSLAPFFNKRDSDFLKLQIDWKKSAEATKWIQAVEIEM